jgi:hypothetical protein
VSGDGKRAEALALSLVRSDPNDAEAWHLLGFTRAVYAWAQARSYTDARAPLERALALDAGFPELTQHAMIMAARDRRFVDVRSLITRAAHDVDIRRQVAGMRAAIAFGTKNPSARDTLKLLLDSGDAMTPVWIGHVLLWTADSLSATEAAFRHVSPERGFPEDILAFSRTNLAALALAAGRWKDGLAQFAALPDSLPQVRTVLPAWFVAMAFVQRPTDEIILSLVITV